MTAASIIAFLLTAATVAVCAAVRLRAEKARTAWANVTAGLEERA